MQQHFQSHWRKRLLGCCAATRCSGVASHCSGRSYSTGSQTLVLTRLLCGCESTTGIMFQRAVVLLCSDMYTDEMRGAVCVCVCVCVCVWVTLQSWNWILQHDLGTVNQFFSTWLLFWRKYYQMQALVDKRLLNFGQGNWYSTVVLYNHACNNLEQVLLPMPCPKQEKSSSLIDSIKS